MGGQVYSSATAGAGPAQVWIDRERAIVAHTDPGGARHVREFSFPREEAARLTALAAVVHCVVDAPQLRVVGAPDMRTLLEREYVAVAHTPDRIIDVG